MYNDDEVGNLPGQEIRCEVRQFIAETDKINIMDVQDGNQELTEIKLFENDSSLVEILRNLLNFKNSVNIVTFCGSISTADLASIRVTWTSSSEKSAEVLQKEVKSFVTSER